MLVIKTIDNRLLLESKQKSTMEKEATLFENIHQTSYTDTVGSVYYVLPAYNEEEALPNLLKRITNLNITHNVKVNVIVVNDGSTDKTAEVAAKIKNNIHLTVVNHKVNMGLGQAVQTGIKEALSNAEYNDIIVIMDADDTHDVSLLDEMITRIEDGADIVIASRFVTGGNDKSAPPFRRLLSRGASLVFKTLLPLNEIKDFTSGYRAYRVRMLKKVSIHYGETLIHEPGFACMVELLLKLRHWSPNIVEIPFKLRYDRKLGASKLKLTKTLVQYLKLAIRDRVTPAPRRK